MNEWIYDGKDLEFKKFFEKEVKKLKKPYGKMPILQIIMAQKIEKALLSMRKHKFRSVKKQAQFITGYLAGNLGL